MYIYVCVGEEERSIRGDAERERTGSIYEIYIYIARYISMDGAYQAKTEASEK